VTLSHVGPDGHAQMVDVGGKAVTARHAVAAGAISMTRATFELVRDGRGPKGDVLTTAELAGVMGAKRTAELIPLCHPLPLDQIDVRADLDPDLPGVRIEAIVRTTARTGVEMEALTAVAVALLTVYDMVKGAGHDLAIGEIVLLEKAGGHGGDWRREV
jgi:cyclic pyranopterin monophosphate synthase